MSSCCYYSSRALSSMLWVVKNIRSRILPWASPLYMPSHGFSPHLTSCPLHDSSPFYTALSSLLTSSRNPRSLRNYASLSCNLFCTPASPDRPRLVFHFPAPVFTLHLCILQARPASPPVVLSAQRKYAMIMQPDRCHPVCPSYPAVLSSTLKLLHTASPPACRP